MGYVAFVSFFIMVIIHLPFNYDNYFVYLFPSLFSLICGHFFVIPNLSFVLSSPVTFILHYYILKIKERITTAATTITIKDPYLSRPLNKALFNTPCIKTTQHEPGTHFSTGEKHKALTINLHWLVSLRRGH